MIIGVLDLVEAARSLPSALPSLLGDGAGPFGDRLGALVGTAGSDPRHARDLLTLLGSEPAVMGWLAARLGVPVEDLQGEMASLGALASAEAGDAHGSHEADSEPHGPRAEPPTGGEEADLEPPSPPGEPVEAEANGGGRGLDEAEADGGEGPHEAEANGGPTPEPSARRILARVSDLSDAATPRPVERAFRAGAPHEVAVAVGPEEHGWIGANRAFPEEALPEDGQTHRLTVLLSMEGVPPRADVIDLPPIGVSTTCRFPFEVGPGPDPVEARIIVGFRNRVLQTAVLRGWVLPDPDAAPAGSAIDLAIESTPRPGMEDLDRRRSFDAALVVSEGGSGPAAVGLGPSRASTFDLDELTPALQPIADILSRIADRPDSYGPGLDSPGSVALLRDLAVQGVELNDHLGRPVLDDLAGGNVDRLQVVSTNPRAFLPIEFVYDLPPPSPRAGLCARWKAALSSGRCDHRRLRPNAEGHVSIVCPLGFWATRKVIERHVVDRAEGSDGSVAIRAEPTGDRPGLAPVSSAVFAASDRVTEALSARVLRTMDTATGNRATRVSTWREWAETVHAESPGLLVLLSHTVDAVTPVALEIGADGERRAAGQITDRFVRGEPGAGPPVVLLLGCDTAVADLGFQTFVAQFREKGAGVVVGTLVSVLGRNAAPVAQAIVRDLARASRSRRAAQTTFGEVMTATRRRLLARGELMSLCLTAYGDADWVLARPSEPR